jgi:hypothetical protein
MFTSYWFEEGCLANPVEFAEPAHIVGQQILLHHSSIFGLLFAHNAVITVSQQLSPLSRFATSPIEGTFLFNDLFGDS